ncbi:MAG: NADH:flavin oxidoreductase/NADH oxidase family protein [Xanthomonadales bacterium]|nr:NADH:flavin oxidoreductase/NADH oxidase family protein [Xanthomonadales bacterium]
MSSEPVSATALGRPLELPCGAVLPNRIAKAAMTEGLASPELCATPRHDTLYRRWSRGGCGLLITGNVQIDRRVLERPGNVAIDGNGGEEALRAWARAGTEAGNHLWMQISHAGRQSPKYVAAEPLAPSEVPLDLMGNFRRPRAVSEDEILDFVRRFADASALARDCGFTGVQLHAAHGYLLSSFLSPVTNRRSDDWGGSLENRARFLLEAVRATRARVGTDFPLSVKLNSDDFRKGGFSHEDCLQVAQWLDREGIDLLEISGGNYEQPQMMGVSGRSESETGVRQSTRIREAYFMDYADSIRKVCRVPLMVTGGFRSRSFMEQALSEGHCDLVGLARPLIVDPELSSKLIEGEAEDSPRPEDWLKLAKTGYFSPASPNFQIRAVNIFGAMGWYYQQIFRLADGKEPDLKMGLLSALLRYQVDEFRTARRLVR